MNIHSLPALALAALFATPLPAMEPDDPSALPHLGSKGREGYQEYQFAGEHKAFVIAPGGAWAWSADHPSADAAMQEALANCAGYTAQRCVPYALDDRQVFDAQQWQGLWGPYKTPAEADESPIGTQLGERFPDLRLVDGAGKAVSLSQWRGRVVVIHFWGSWCPPCCRELPDLARLQETLATERLAVDLLLVPVREQISEARQWLEKQGIELPLYDAGAHGGDGGENLKLSDGSTLGDRVLAETFPATYVLDRHGVVIFSHLGPIPRWREYLPFLQDAAARSGR